jgi:hypothetical protein
MASRRLTNEDRRINDCDNIESFRAQLSKFSLQ